MKKLCLIIPAYNEEKSLPKLFAKLDPVISSLNYSVDCVVVNDGSRDNTGSIAETLNCRVLDLAANLGIGGAVQTGLKFAHSKDYDFAMQVDADGQHPPDEIIKLLNQMEKTSADMVIGSRFISREGFQSTVLRRVGISYFSSLLSFFSGQLFSDPTSGLRLFNRKSMGFFAEHYADEFPEPESLLVASLLGLRVEEVPVIMKERTDGKSSIHSTRSVYFMAKVTLALFFAYIKFKYLLKHGYIL
ncbi:MAG: glycosyltransferase family 2 protein [Ignavibacteriaceae bacterium]